MWVEKMQQGAATLERGLITYRNQRMGELVGWHTRRCSAAPARVHRRGPTDLEYDALLAAGSGRCRPGGDLAAAAPTRPTCRCCSPSSRCRSDGASLGVLVTDLTAQRHHDQLARALRERERLGAETAEDRQPVGGDRRKSEFLADARTSCATRSRRSQRAADAAPRARRPRRRRRRRSRWSSATCGRWCG